MGDPARALNTSILPPPSTEEMRAEADAAERAHHEREQLRAFGVLGYDVYELYVLLMAGVGLDELMRCKLRRWKR